MVGQLDPESAEGVSPAPARPGWVVLGNGQRAELAGPGARLGARTIDLLLAGVASAVGGIVGLLLGSVATRDATGLEALSEFFLWGFAGIFFVFVVAAMVEVSMVRARGQTFGKMAVGIKVVRTADGQNPSWRDSAKRWAVPWLIPLLFLLVAFPVALVTLVVYFSMLGDERRQGWHDKYAGTLVVEK